MYVGVDVGGTKTLVAVLDNDGVILESTKFPTPENYKHFLLELRHTLAHFEHHDFIAGGVGIPTSRFDRKLGIAHRFGNLPWKDVPVQADLERILDCPVVIENDAKMGSLSEAMMLPKSYSKVLYVTISTGIGFGLTVDRTIDSNLGDAGGHTVLLEHDGKFVNWESFASGKAIVARYGKRAEDIHDDATWQKIVRDLTMGFLELIALMQPDVVVIGGSVGNYFERFKPFLVESLKQYETPSLIIPVFKKAKRPEHAVVYGCYDLAKATFGPHAQRVHKKAD